MEIDNRSILADLYREESGSVIIVTLVILVLLTIMGISATTTSEIELQIAGNEIIYKQNLYNAEASSMEAIQSMEDTDLTVNPSYITATENSVSDADVRVASNWSNNFSGNVTPNTGSLGNSQYIAVYEGMEDLGESLDMTRAKIHAYKVYGRSNINNGVSVIKMGYRKAF